MADKTAILSVGIDVGTSTTQVVFSKLQMDNAGGYFSVPRVAIVDKEVVYKSEIYMTPLKTDVLIDTEALRDIVAAEFRKAGYRPEDTDSGAVIITGESARKENSDAVLKSLSDFAGDFVVSAAGPDMESLIAGKGSGAWQYSMDHHCRVANLDIGGGTTNVVLFEDGETVARGCLDIGGRLICMNPQGIITKVSSAAAVMAQAAGVSVHVGDRCDEKALSAVTRQMAAALNVYLGVGTGTSAGGKADAAKSDAAGHHVVGAGNGSSLCAVEGTKDINAILRQIKTPGSSDFPVPEKVQAVFFSGGVADLIYHESADTWAYGDIADVGDDNLGMLPIYIGAPGEEKQGLCTGTENYWCVNKNASKEDIQATLDFMNWCVTSEEGTKMMCSADGMGFVIPFKNNLESENPLVNIANDYMEKGYTPVDWTFSTMPSEQWKNDLGSALTTYAADQTDANWKLVQTAFVDGWAKEAAAATK